MSSGIIVPAGDREGDKEDLQNEFFNELKLLLRKYGVSIYTATCREPVEEIRFTGLGDTWNIEEFEQELKRR